MHHSASEISIRDNLVTNPFNFRSKLLFWKVSSFHPNSSKSSDREQFLQFLQQWDIKLELFSLVLFIQTSPLKHHPWTEADICMNTQHQQFSKLTCSFRLRLQPKTRSRICSTGLVSGNQFSAWSWSSSTEKLLWLKRLWLGKAAWVYADDKGRNVKDWSSKMYWIIKFIINTQRTDQPIKSNCPYGWVENNSTTRKGEWEGSMGDAVQIFHYSTLQMLPTVIHARLVLQPDCKKWRNRPIRV